MNVVMSMYVKCGVMSVYAKCGAMGNVALSDMVQLKCKMFDVKYDGVEWGVLVCGMLHNARCGKLQCDVKCGGVELW